MGARSGSLSILAGGDPEDYEVCLPLFRAMGANINLQGHAGCGQHAKLANQIIITGTLSGLCEALVYVGRNGLDRHKLAVIEMRVHGQQHQVVVAGENRIEVEAARFV